MRSQITIGALRDLQDPVPATTTASRRSAIVDVQPLVDAQPFDEVRPFEKMGEWGESISVAQNGTSLRLIRWLSLNRERAHSPRALWEACKTANAACFREYRIVRMRKPSFFLPAGEVVFEVLENPTQIPDHPPRGVMLRHQEALAAAPGATFYFLRPVFTATPYFRLYTPWDLREEAEMDRDDALFSAKLWGWAFRSAVWSRRRMEDLATLALRTATAAVRLAAYGIGPAGRWHARRRVRDHGFRMLSSDLDAIIARHTASGLAVEREALRRALIELQTRAAIDPILCFELPDRPGELRFEAHWFMGTDGRMYVHY